MTLPPGWAWTTLGEVATLVGGGTPSRERPDYFTGHIVWLTPTEIPKDRVAVILDSRERITEEALRKSSARLVPKDTVLMTSRASIGYVAIAGTDVSTNQGFASFICEAGVHNSYLAYWLWANADHFIEKATGTTFKEITKSKLRLFAFPLAPLPEQRRIVAKLEELVTRLDAGVAALKDVRAKLKRYKAAVLKAASEGRLVPQDPNDEPASQLLQRILAERKAKWEADLRARGKDPSKAKYVEPKPPDADRLPELPSRWCWATLNQLSWDAGYGTSQKCDYEASGPPVLRIPNIVNGGFDLSDTKYATNGNALADTDALAPGDLLIIRTNGSKDLIGRTGLVRETFDPPHFFASYLIRYRILDLYLAAWLSAIWDASSNRRKIEQIAATSAGQYNVSVSSLNRITVPIPPLTEQFRIVAEVERRLSVVQELEGAVAASLARAGRLRQAILKRAFEGKLVPQDPSDEPASVLLQRISMSRSEPIAPNSSKT